VTSFEAQTNDSAAAEALVRLGRLQAKEGRLESGRGYLERAFEHLEGIGATTAEMAAHEGMAELCELEDNHVQALHHTRCHHALFKAVYDIETRSELKNLNLRNEMQRAAKDAEIHRLRYVELEGMQTQLLQAERMAALGGLAAGLAHEVNNPLGVIQSNLDLTERATGVLERALPQQDPRPKRTQAALDALRSGVKASTQASDRIHHLVKSLGRFVRLDESDYIESDLVEGLQSALTLLAPSIPAGVEVVQNLSPIPKMLCYASEINQAFMTLLRNAIDAIEGQGQITVSARADGSHAQIEIRDSGRGMDDKQLQGIFDLGFAAHGKRVRFRLGLPTAAATIKKHGGTIEVSSQPGAGTQFILRLPLAGKSE
jgi:two-component system NtrC family sensor kinase